MMAPNSEVLHDEILLDRIGNNRQCDVVIRGEYAGWPILGIIECKDHSRKKGPDEIEAFAKKTEHLRANFRLFFSRKGFTQQALRLAEHENIGCLSLLPDDPDQAGFSIGQMFYGVVDLWRNTSLQIHFAPETIHNTPFKFDSESVLWQGKPVFNWFLRELFTTHKDAEPSEPGKAFVLTVKFDQPTDFEIDGKSFRLTAISCISQRSKTYKKKWVSWSGDAFYDWHKKRFTVPPKGLIVGSSIESDVREWDDYEGELPDMSNENNPGFLNVIVHYKQAWDSSLNQNTPDLSSFIL